VRAALAFLTPLGGARRPEPRALVWFPVVGAAIGACVGVVWWGADEWWTPIVAAALAVLADVVLTGALHLDGLADTADGVLPHLERDRRLVIMGEPTIGAFGVTALVAAIVLRVALLTAIEPDVALLAALWCASRTTMAVTTGVVRYARPGGLATAFLGRSPWPTLVVGAVGSLGLGLLALQGQGVFAVLAVGLGGAVVVGFAARRLGGFTGDVLGAAGVVGETVGLLVATAAW
jgi:adenosylcobinamide-GDP ribazoletransferase